MVNFLKKCITLIQNTYNQGEKEEQNTVIPFDMFHIQCINLLALEFGI
jgi:hypothetical protein